MDGGPWWARVHRVAKDQTCQKQLSSSSRTIAYKDCADLGDLYIPDGALVRLKSKRKGDSPKVT